MRDKHNSPAKLSKEIKAVEQAIEQAMSRAVQHALLTHKRAGNTVAAWKDGRVELVHPDNIQVKEPAKAKRK